MHTNAMQYTETLTIRPECQQCPNLARLADVHAQLDEARLELSHAIMSGEITQALFTGLLQDGYSVEEAEQFLAEKAAAIHTENMAALDEIEAQQAAVTSVSEKMIADCRPEGAFEVPGHVQEHICMSALLAVTLE